MNPRLQIVGRLPVDLSRRVRAAATRQQVSLHTFLIEALTRRRRPAATRRGEGGPMTNPDLSRTLDVVANRMQVIAGLTTERRRSVNADAQAVIELEDAVDRVVRLLRALQPTHTGDA